MTPEFDRLYNEIIEEAAKSACKYETLPQLSDSPHFKFQRCVQSPYTSGFRLLNYIRTDGSFDYDKRCKKKNRKGTEAWESCNVYNRVKRRRQLMAIIRAKRKAKIK